MTFNGLYLRTDGRIGREAFWLGLGGLLFVGMVVWLVLNSAFGMATFMGRLLMLAMQFILAYPAFAIFAKRFQDRDKPAVLGLILILLGLAINFVSLAGATGDPINPNLLGWILRVIDLVAAFWFLIELGILRGTIGQNRYGPDPLPPRPPD
jgi:uncharacterized membrane protein YhaH (DUF805 family)